MYTAHHPCWDAKFQSTLPSRGATPAGQRHVGLFEFQSTLPSRGATLYDAWQERRMRHFNPRSPRGERPDTIKHFTKDQHFNPRSPRGERLLLMDGMFRIMYFNPRSPRGERFYVLENLSTRCHFNPRSPRGERRETDKYYLLFRDKNSMFSAICTAKSINPFLKPRFRTRYVHFF